ncbi:MAG: response regulator [Chloroflexota bacterium]|nr:response regulator [Chloroflexota bacterium]
MNIPQGPILIVEDMPNILDLIKVTLTFKGYPVVTATNGEEALARIEDEKPALIITDILMPYMDGFAFIQNIRTNPDTSEIPVIFLSATYLTPEDKKFAFDLGAVRFLEKPIDTEEFLLTIAEVLTQGVPDPSPPLKQEKFHKVYKERLEHKLQYKKAQIARVKNLLQTLPDEQKLAFEDLYKEACNDRDVILAELEKF